MDTELQKRYADVQDRVARGCGGREVCLIAVSKTQSSDRVAELYALGHRDFGENYAQEMLSKARELEARGCTGIRWHFIGHLQTNKVKSLAGVWSAVHSVDSEKLACVMAREANAPLPVFVEVNLSGEASKGGVAREAVRSLAESISRLSTLELQGLMCIPEAGISPESLRARFRELRELERSLGELSRRKLSMGMSADFEIALAEGATHVRVGTSLFGPR